MKTGSNRDLPGWENITVLSRMLEDWMGCQTVQTHGNSPYERHLITVVHIKHTDQWRAVCASWSITVLTVVSLLPACGPIPGTVLTDGE